MSEEKENPNAEVTSVYPNKVEITVHELSEFKEVDEQTEELSVGSYLEISDNSNCKLIAVIESYSIEVGENEGDKSYIIEAQPLGILEGNEFSRGGDTFTIPPTDVRPAKAEDIEKIYETQIEPKNKFCFSTLSQDDTIDVPVNGDKFFNKHFAIIGATGSGKSHTVAKIIQRATSKKKSDFEGLNNSHVVIFDIHGEYKSAFPESNFISVQDLKLPYWLLNSEELEELFLESGDHNNYNQASILRSVITENKKKYNEEIDKIFYDSPLRFDINEVLNCLVNLQNETINYKCRDRYMLGYETGDDRSTDVESGVKFESTSEKYKKYFKRELNFYPTKGRNIKKGNYADGTLDKFIERLKAKIKDERLKFLFGENSKDIEFEKILRQFLGYREENSNVTIIDLSGVPFEVLNITVSLISRILFDYSYHYKNLLEEEIDCETPLLLLYEEAHKYAPKEDLARHKPSKKAIERIAKEGRKYGVTLGIVSQRPSEISETIFSQCNNFVSMRLTNPDDQNYVKKLLPDTMGNITDKLPTLRSGEGLLIGDSVIMPSVVKVDKCENKPSSNDIPYLEIWKEKWKDVDFGKIIEEWKK